MFRVHSSISNITQDEIIAFVRCSLHLMLTDASFVVILYFVTRVTRTEVATSGVGTILVASTDVPCTLVNI